MEREHRSILTLFAPEPFAAEATLRLDADAAQHARARRVHPGDAVRVLDGAGTAGAGVIASIAKQSIEIRVEALTRTDRPAALEVLVPVADKDRMLLAAEKCVELQITAWRPVRFARSMSVGTRGEGKKFREKIAARMRSALEQSGGAWLPVIHDEADIAAALAEVAIERRFVLDAGGQPLHGQTVTGAVAIAVGPEGGFESAELARFQSSGWVASALGTTTLRFETAVIGAAAIVRAAQFSHRRT